jgi:hypothetical protein
MVQPFSEVDIVVGSLTLSGFSAAESDRLRRHRHHIGSAFEAELHRLVEQQVEGGQPWELEPLATAELTLPPGQSPDRIGIELARAIFRGLQPRLQP